MSETYYQASPRDWRPGDDLQPDVDGRLELWALERAVERVGDRGGWVLEISIETNEVFEDWSGQPYATKAIPGRRIRVLGS